VGKHDGKLFVVRVRVVGFIADEPFGKLVEEAGSKNLFHKPALGTIAVGIDMTRVRC
jgi:hypothetical protein